MNSHTHVCLLHSYMRGRYELLALDKKYFWFSRIRGKIKNKTKNK